MIPQRAGEIFQAETVSGREQQQAVRLQQAREMGEQSPPRVILAGIKDPGIFHHADEQDDVGRFVEREAEEVVVDDGDIREGLAFAHGGFQRGAGCSRPQRRPLAVSPR